MALVNKSDLESVTSSLSIIDEIISSNQQMITQINSFCTNTVSMLQGGGYDAARQKMAVYQDAFNKQNQILANLKNNMTAANNSLSNYMEEYTSLDDSQIGVVRESLSAAERHLSYLKSQDPDEYPGLSAAIALCEQEIARLKKLLAKLEGLAGADASSYGMISGVEADVVSYKSAIGNIDVTTFNF